MSLESVVQSHDAYVGGIVDFLKVGMAGTLYAVLPSPHISLSEVHEVVVAQPFSNKVQIEGWLTQMKEKSLSYSKLKGMPPAWEAYRSYSYAVIRTLHAKPYNVYSIQESTWRAANGLRIIGDENSVFIINVWGKNPNMIEKSIVLNGGVKLSHVLLNFPEAEEMTITRSGTENGVPSILAPLAKVHHYGNLISGGLMVGDYDGWYAGNCGQVNSHSKDHFHEIK